MNQDKLVEKISTFLNKEFNKKTGDVSVFENTDGSYEVFNRYRISKDKLGFRVSVKNESQEKIFSSVKVALTWCIFEKKKDYVKSLRIEYLDIMINGTEMAINNHRRLVKGAKDTHAKLVYIAKLSEEKARYKSMSTELAKCIIESRYWQNKNFANS